MSSSSWGVPGSLELKPEITAPRRLASTRGWNCSPAASYENMSGTSMAAPQVAGMAALVGQYIRESGLEEKTGHTARQRLRACSCPRLCRSWRTLARMRKAMTWVTATIPVLRQGAGLANVGAAVSADSYILMGEDATKSYADGKSRRSWATTRKRPAATSSPSPFQPDRVGADLRSVWGSLYPGSVYG